MVSITITFLMMWLGQSHSSLKTTLPWGGTAGSLQHAINILS